jgi:hypothetical protein
MMIKDLGPRVESVWEGLRPMTKNMLVGALRSGSSSPTAPPQKFSYDTHSDWELSRLLTALDEQSKSASAARDNDNLSDINKLADTCVSVLESQTGSAEVFIQLATRALDRKDYSKLDKLSDRLSEQFSAAEIAEIVNQTDLPQIRAIAYETLAMLPVRVLSALLDDPLYSDIAANALEQKAYEFDSEEARDVLEQFDGELPDRETEN